MREERAMRILLVDDDAVILEDICRSIHWDKLGIDQVDVAQDAASASGYRHQRH